MAEIIWTETALNNIDNIAEYISVESIFYASQFVQKILSFANKLEKYPQIGKPVPELSGYSYHEIVFKKYRVIYRIHSDIVYIISVHPLFTIIRK